MLTKPRRRCEIKFQFSAASGKIVSFVNTNQTEDSLGYTFNGTRLLLLHDSCG